MELVYIGVIAALAILFLLLKLNVRRVCGYAFEIDLLATIALVVMFAGTFSGMVAAVVGGSIISIALYTMKHLYGAERLTRKGWREVR